VLEISGGNHCSPWQGLSSCPQHDGLNEHSISRAKRRHLLKTYHPKGHPRATSVPQQHSKQLGPAVHCYGICWLLSLRMGAAQLAVKLAGVGK